MANETPPQKTKATEADDRAALLARIEKLEKEREDLRFEVSARDADAKEERARAEAILAEREKAKAGQGANRMIGHVQVFLLDEPDDIVERARSLMRGQIPVERAKRFKTDARIRVPKDHKLALRLGRTELPIGTEFDAHEMGDEDRATYHAQGAIVAVG